MDNFEEKEKERINDTSVKFSQDVRYYYDDSRSAAAKQGGIPGWIKGIIILVLIIGGLVLLTRSCGSMLNNTLGGGLFSGSGVDVEAGDFFHDYIGVLHVETTISENGTSSAYNHDYLLSSINGMMDDSHNKGIILYLNTPGGSVYASDELYLKIKEYQEVTGRPVYSAMQSMAASGGYYISAPADKIFANRNCWTGSIGVTIGTIYDASGLLEKWGIKSQTITSGANKAMGSNTQPMTKEQRAIFQSLVDEAYEQFVGIVAEGRDMPVSKVKKLADGRIYTAKQACELGLIDQVGTFEEAVADMKRTYKLGSDCAVEDFLSADEVSLFSSLGITAGDKLLGAEMGAVKEIMGLSGKFEISYMAPIEK